MSKGAAQLKNLGQSAKSEKVEKTGPGQVVEGPFDARAIEVKLKKWFPDLSQDTVMKLVAFQLELIKVSKLINLVTPQSLKNAEVVHIADAIYAARLVVPGLHPNEPVYDIGSGGGLPGLVFAILYPNISFVLVDRDQRRMDFCKQVIKELGIKNATVQVQGVEDVPQKSMKNVVSRGLATLPKSLLMLRKAMPKGGRYFHLKGDGWANELAQVPSQLFSHWTPSLVGQYRLPEVTGDLSVVLTEKISE